MTNQLTSKNKSKLYVSCVTECPINGKIPIEQVAFKINNNLLNAIGDPTVPRLMIFNHHGEAKINLLGFKPKDELLLLMREHLDAEC